MGVSKFVTNKNIRLYRFEAVITYTLRDIYLLEYDAMYLGSNFDFPEVQFYHIPEDSNIQRKVGASQP